MTAKTLIGVVLCTTLAIVVVAANGYAIEVCDQQKQACIYNLQPACVDTCSEYLEEWGILYHGQNWQLWCLYNPTYCQAIFDQCYVACMAEVEATCEGVRIECEENYAR